MTVPHDDMTDGFDDFRDGFLVTIGLLILGVIVGAAAVLGLLALMRVL